MGGESLNLDLFPSAMSPVHAGWLMAAQDFVVMGTMWTVCSAPEVARCLQILSAAQFRVISDDFCWRMNDE